MEKLKLELKHNVGDKVRIKSLNWYNQNKSNDGNIDCNYVFVIPMSKYCGKIATIVLKERKGCYSIDIDNGMWCWTDNMFDKNV